MMCRIYVYSSKENGKGADKLLTYVTMNPDSENEIERYRDLLEQVFKRYRPIICVYKAIKW